MTPSEYFKKEVIGKIVTKTLKIQVHDQRIELKESTHLVIEIETSPNNTKIYICNEWYKEYKKIPLIISEDLVKEFYPKE